MLTDWNISTMILPSVNTHWQLTKTQKIGPISNVGETNDTFVGVCEMCPSTHHCTIYTIRCCWCMWDVLQHPSLHYLYYQMLVYVRCPPAPITALSILSDVAGVCEMSPSTHHCTIYTIRCCWCMWDVPQHPSLHYLYYQMLLVYVRCPPAPITALSILSDVGGVCEMSPSTHHCTIYTIRCCWCMWDVPQHPSLHYLYYQMLLVYVRCPPAPITALSILSDVGVCEMSPITALSILSDVGVCEMSPITALSILSDVVGVCEMSPITALSILSDVVGVCEMSPSTPSLHYLYYQMLLVYVRCAPAPITALSILSDVVGVCEMCPSTHHCTIYTIRCCWCMWDVPQHPSLHYLYYQMLLVYVRCAPAPITALSTQSDVGVCEMSPSTHHCTIYTIRCCWCMWDVPQHPSLHYLYCQMLLVYVRCPPAPITALSILSDVVGVCEMSPSTHHCTIYTVRCCWCMWDVPQHPSLHYLYCQMLLVYVRCPPAPITALSIPWVGVKNFGFTEEQKKSSRGPLRWRNSMFVSCVFKRRWRLGGRKCRKMPERDIRVCRKAKVVELHIVCMLK